MRSLRALTAFLLVACSPLPPVAIDHETPEKKPDSHVEPAPSAMPLAPPPPAPLLGTLIVEGEHGLLACKKSNAGDDAGAVVCVKAPVMRPPPMLSVVRDVTERYIVPGTDGRVVLWTPGHEEVESFANLTYSVAHEQQVAYLLDDGGPISLEYRKTGDEVSWYSSDVGWIPIYHATENKFSFSFLADHRHIFSHYVGLDGEATRRDPSRLTQLFFAEDLRAKPRLVAQAAKFWDADFSDNARLITWTEDAALDAATDERICALQAAPIAGGVVKEIARVRVPAHAMFFGERKPFNGPPFLRTAIASRWAVIGIDDKRAMPRALRAIDLEGQLAAVDYQIPDGFDVAQPIPAGGSYHRTRRASEAVVIEQRVAEQRELVVLRVPSFEEIMRVELPTRDVINVDFLDEKR